MTLDKKLYLSTIAEDAEELAGEFSFGIELADFCTAEYLDGERERWISHSREAMRAADRFTLHAPFNELCPFAVDPMVRAVTKVRFEQTWEVMQELGVKRMVVHSGHIPILYYDCWFIEKSIEFWRDFLSDKPQDFRLLIENVVDISPEPLAEIMKGIDDERCGICLDVGHAFVASKQPPDEWVTALLPWLYHVHVHDNLGDHDSHLPLGQGKIDWQHLLTRMLTEATNATYTIENMHCRESLHWLAAHGFLQGSGSK